MSDQQLLERRIRETLLDRAAGVAATPALYDRVERGIRHHRRRSSRLVPMVAVAAAVIGGLLVIDITGGPDLAVTVDQPARRVSFDVRLHEPDKWTSPVSQTAAEAARDGVPARMALIPTERRVPGDGPSLSAGGGLTWRFGPRAVSLGRLAPDCGGGDLCAGQYSEALLVNERGEILLAHALPLADGSGILSTNQDGHLEGRTQAGGMSGDTIVFRFGTSPGDRQVVVYPGADSPFLGAEDARWPLAPEGEEVVLPEGWTVMPQGTPPPALVDLGSDDTTRRPAPPP